MRIRYVQGYLASHLAPASDASRVRVVRQEDLLRRPDAVVDDLAKDGLNRNAIAFTPLEMLRTGYQITSRKETLHREAEALSTFYDHVKRTIINPLMSSGCEPQMQALGYPMPEKHTSGSVPSACLLEIEDHRNPQRLPAAHGHLQRKN